MCGVYIHIPFCQSRCQYCDFFSTTLLSRRKAYIDALIAEWQERRVAPQEIGTIYIGGGTPSLLDTEDIGRVIGEVAPLPMGTARVKNAENAENGGDAEKPTAPLKGEREVTMEANPGDLTLDKLVALRAVGVNRISIGIQSFSDRLLRLIGRRHTAAQAREVVNWCREAGIDNISIDLMYGLPTQTMDEWQASIDEALKLDVQHISAYCLTYEENTLLYKRMVAGEFDETDEDTANAMNEVLCDRLRDKGYEHYEVSNFALPGYRSQHNSGYWNFTPYIGLGAGAHSYDGQSRSWNISDVDEYITSAMAHNLHRETEVLTDEQKRMEYIMLGLRTREGIVLDGKRIVPTEQDWHVLNRIVERLV